MLRLVRLPLARTDFLDPTCGYNPAAKQALKEEREAGGIIDLIGARRILPAGKKNSGGALFLFFINVFYKYLECDLK